MPAEAPADPWPVPGVVVPGALGSVPPGVVGVVPPDGPPNCGTVPDGDGDGVCAGAEATGVAGVEAEASAVESPATARRRSAATLHATVALRARRRTGTRPDPTGVGAVGANQGVHPAGVVGDHGGAP